MPVDINQLALLGVGALVTVMILAVAGQLGLSYLSQRNLNDLLAQGMQGVVGVNTLEAADRRIERRPERPREREVREVREVRDRRDREAKAGSGDAE